MGIKEKSKLFIKNLVLVVSLYLMCQFFVVEYFRVDFDQGGFFYAIASTIIIVYCYGKHQTK